MIRQSGFHRRGLLRKAAALAAAGGIAAGSAETVESAGSLTDVGDLRVGHFTDSRRPTGCTVVLFDKGAVAGVDVRGSAPGTRETDLLHPLNSVEKVNAITLAGGSAYGLDSATGVMRYLEERNQGFHMGSIVVPIVPAAILFDLNVGDPKIRPDAHAGYSACMAAARTQVAEGNVGAGAGATVGKFFGLSSAMKGGIGTASVRVGESSLIVGAIVAVNAVGDVVNANTGKTLAGSLTADRRQFRRSRQQIASGALMHSREDGPHVGANTTIGIVATNAIMTKTQMTKVAQMAHDGLARSIDPVHTVADGDTIFAAATGSSRVPADLTTIGVAAAEALEQAVHRAVLMAEGIPGYPAWRDLPPGLR